MRLDKICHNFPKIYRAKHDFLGKTRRIVYIILGLKKHHDKQSKKFLDFYNRIFSEKVKGKTILDVGCGPGDNLNNICNRYTCHGIGLDLSQRSISAAEKKYPQHRFITGDANKIPLKDGSADIVFLNAVFHHIPPRNNYRVLNEARRVAKDYVIILDSVNFDSRVGKLVGTLYWKLTDYGYVYRNKKDWLKFFENRDLEHFFCGSGCLMRQCIFVIRSNRKKYLNGEKYMEQNIGGFVMMKNQKICSRCIMDTSVPGIRFDERGICNFCKMHDELEKRHPLNELGQRKLNQLVEEIKAKGKNKDYDCIVGFSGGRDSTYTLYTAVKRGLRPLAVHFDNGWNSEIAVDNIKKATTKLDVDLHTVVADWEEFKDLQKSFLKASVPDAEIPTDYVIISVLYQTAAEIGTKYILTGHSFRTEGISPQGWTYMDGRYVKNVHSKFGKAKLESFPVMSLSELLYYILIKRINFIYPLEYMHYNQEQAGEILKKELDWVYYGGHHHENIYTHFFQSYLCPKKFNIDKRKLEYSALIRSGQMTREEALKEIRKNPYPYDREIVDYTINKLGLTKEEFEEMLSAKPRTFHDYPTYYPIIKACRIPIKIACKLNLLPQVFYEKYFG